MNELFTPTNKTIFGYRIAQTWSALYMLEKTLLENQDINRIVELGTGYGGLALFFGINLSITRLTSKVLTIDVTNKFLRESWFKWAKRFNVNFRKMDVFNQETVNLVKDFTKDDRVLLFCDNGKKSKEFPLYSRIIKKNDLIMAHDWGIEIKRDDLDSETMSLLKPYNQENFDRFKTLILSMVKK